jgi:WD40 repeat protein
MTNSQAQDTMSWGFDTGLIIVLNIRTCEIVLKFNQNSAVTSLCFTENDNLLPRLLSGSSDGQLISWNLTTSSFKCKKMIFSSEINFIQFIATDRVSEIILCGSHRGNGLRMLAYDDQELGDYRILKSRQGLEGFVNEIRFINDKHLMVQSDHESGEIFNCWIWNDSASLRLSDKFSSAKVTCSNLFKLIILRIRKKEDLKTW